MVPNNQNRYKQESIPLECVPTTEVASLLELWLGYAWIPGNPIPPDTLLPDTLPPGYSTPWKVHGTTGTLPLERTWYQGYPTPSVDRKTPVKTLPSCNFISSQ